MPATALALVGLSAPTANAANPAGSCVLNASNFDCTLSYGYTGGQQTFDVPNAVSSVSVVGVGGTGGAYIGSATPGRGAVVSGNVAVTAGSTYYVVVGGNGSNGSTAGGFNGGGTAGGPGGRGGGGATDLRSSAASLASRLLVAGAGGGTDISGSNGGDSGLDGQSGVSGSGANGTPGAGGTQSAGGAGGTGGSPTSTSGQLGAGGNGGRSYGGGGGGGFYGGGGGGGSTSGVGNGGGGGSSLVPTGGTVTVNSTGQAPRMSITYASPVTAATGLVLTNQVAAGVNNPVQITVTDGQAVATTTPTTLAVSPNGAGTGATCTATACSATQVGTYTVTGTYAGFTATRSFTVVAGPLATTTLSPDNASITAGGTQQYTVTGVDAYGNSLGDLTSSSTVTRTRSGGSAAACPGALCSATQSGSYVVNSSTPGANGAVLDTATLTVTPDALATLAIAPQNATTPAGVGVQYTVSGTDQYGNDRPGQTAVITLSSPEGDVACPSGVCTPTKAGARTVTARAPGAGSTTVSVSTGLNVIAADAATLTLTPSNATTKAGTPVAYTVGGFDGYGNALPDQTSASTVTYDPAAGPSAPVTCANATCGPTVAGLYTVIASQSGLNAPAPASGTLTVVAAGLDSTTLSPADATTQAGVQTPYTVTGTDAYGNDVGDVTSTSTVTVSGPSGTDIACPSGVCVLETVGDHVVTATTPRAVGGTTTSTAILHVVAAPLRSIVISPDGVTITAGQSVTYTVTGSDTYGNDLGDVTSDSQVSYAPAAGGLSTNCPAATCTVGSGGTYRITAVLGSASDTATLVVRASQAAVTVTPVAGVTYGQDVPVSATVTSPDGPVTGTVQFSLDGQALGQPVALDSSGTANRPNQSGVHAGLHTLKAEFLSASGQFTIASDRAGFVVAKAPTTTALVVRSGSLTATVTGAGNQPTGSVRFTIDGRDAGAADLIDGVATYTGNTDTDRDSVVTGSYTGDSDHNGSVASTVRQDPSITATISGATQAGWHKAVVTVTFECVAGSGAVVCPAPVVLATEGADQYVTRTITAADGGVAAVTVGPINIDLTAPTVELGRVVDGRNYRGAVARAVCRGTDALSGLTSCKVTTSGGPFGTITSTATATDVAGNVATESATYRVHDAWLSKSSFNNGAWSIAQGKRRALHVMSDGRPTLKPRSGVAASRFTREGQRYGLSYWSATITVQDSVKPGTVLRLRIAGDAAKRTVKARVTR